MFIVSNILCIVSFVKSCFCFDSVMDARDVVEDSCVDYCATEVVDSDCNFSLFQVGEPVFLAATVGGWSDVVSIGGGGEGEMPTLLLMLLYRSRPIDKQVCILVATLGVDASCRTKVGLSLRSLSTNFQACLCYSSNF